jgi:2-oxoglutarate ferredoxin oxidoreductase subunit alpha
LEKFRKSLKIAGESGMGINSAGELFTKALKNVGYYVFGYREYPSLIEGGNACYQVDISNSPVNSSKKFVEILLCISRESIFEYLNTLGDDGILVHNSVRLILKPEHKEYIDKHRIQVIFFDTEKIIKENYGTKIMSNMVLLGYAWGLLGLKKSELKEQIEESFKSKPNYIDVNVKMMGIGMEENSKILIPNVKSFELPENKSKKVSLKNAYVISGNHAISLGAVKAGVRAYYSYPMTPASSILTYMAAISHKTGVLIKQAEDEITAAQMALGSMFMGTRAFTSTSGGGFDLMTETISLSGMSETPLVIVLAQRPGPATGLPTWTGAGDLDLAVYSGHGEFPRCVVAVSDSKDAYEIIQRAFNISEKFQLPVVVLTEKQIAESNYLTEEFYDVASVRSLSEIPTGVSDQKRYDLNEVIAKRWVPGSSNSYFLSNSDEHNERGDSIEDAETSNSMLEKRMKKLGLLKSTLPDPEFYGDTKAKKILVGWGSVKNSVIDALPDKGIGYLHYTYLFPTRTEKLENLYRAGKEIYLVENNFTGQLGKLIQQNSEVKFKEKFLKYDGRPFFYEEVVEFISKIMNEKEAK